MVKSIKKTFPLISLTFLGIIFLFVFYPKITLSPNSYLFNFQGDGLTSYHNFTYHIKYDSSFVEFEGMNYPFSEHIVYAVNNPLLANAVKLISLFWPEVVEYSVGIHNISILFGMLLCLLILYFILRHYKISPWFSVLFAFGIMVLSPQIHRISGHYSLGYLFFIPLTWYLIIRFTQKSQNTFWNLALFLNILFWIFIHPYLGVIATVLNLCFFSVYFILNHKSIKRKLYYFLRIIFIVFLPLIIFRLFVFYTDQHLGRTTNPYGFLVFVANFDTVFFPSHPPFRSIINHFYSIQNQIWEGWAYIGLAAIFGIFSFLLLSIFESFRQVKIIFYNKFFQNKELKSFMIAGILILLFSMGYPFRLGLQGLAEVFPVLKEFRALGRFAWVWFYIINISSVYFFYHLVNSFKGKWRFLKPIGLLILGALIVIEGLAYHQDNKRYLFNEPNYFNKEMLPQNYKDAISKIEVAEYQAIIPLPFYNKGSGNFEIVGTHKSMHLSTLFSYHCGLPILGNYLARTNISESKKMSQLISPSFIKKEIEKELPSKKKFLITYSKDQISIYEQQIIDKSRTLYEDEELVILEISVSDFFKNNSKEIITNFNEIKNTLYLRENLLATSKNAFLYYDSFDDKNSSKSYLGAAALKVKKNLNKTICNIDNSLLDASKTYTLSFWMYNTGANFGQDVLNCKIRLIKLKANDESEIFQEFKPMFCVVIDGNWSRIEMEFQINKNDKEIKLIIGSDTDDRISDFIVDELLIKEKGLNVYKNIDIQDSSKILFYNGFKIEDESSSTVNILI